MGAAKLNRQAGLTVHGEWRRGERTLLWDGLWRAMLASAEDQDSLIAQPEEKGSESSSSRRTNEHAATR
jgi:hypothetical protein